MHANSTTVFVCHSNTEKSKNFPKKLIKFVSLNIGLDSYSFNVFNELYVLVAKLFSSLTLIAYNSVFAY